MSRDGSSPRVNRWVEVLARHPSGWLVLPVVGSDKEDVLNIARREYSRGAEEMYIDRYDTDFERGRHFDDRAAHWSRWCTSWVSDALLYRGGGTCARERLHDGPCRVRGEEHIGADGLAWTRVGANKGVRYRAFALPGNDCIRHPCGKDGCTREHPQHGIRSIRWVYTVTDDRSAITLHVIPHIYPSSVGAGPLDQDGRPYPVEGDCFLFCSAWPQTDGDLARGVKQSPCIVMRDAANSMAIGKCFPGEPWCRGAKTFWEKLGSKGFEQSASFWSELEAMFVSERAAAEVRRAKVRCYHCGGTGVLHERGAER